MRRIKQAFLTGILLINIACAGDSQVEISMENTPYFDLKGLLNQQITLLDSLNPEVEIQALIGSEQAHEVMHKDSADWAETLELYADADLNKPVLRDQYLIQDSILAGSDLQVRIYRAKQPEGVDIPFMKVYYENDISRVRRVETFFRENNPLYSTQRSMALHFGSEDGLLRLMSYSTSGKQKMIFRDSVLYKTDASIRY